MKLMLAADMSFNFIETIPAKEKIHAFMREPAELFQMADFSIVNLENVFGERNEHTPIVKDGPNLISSADYAEYIRALSPTVVGIANNHTMDYGVAPMRQTKALLESEGYLCIGAGENLQEAYRPAILEKDGVKVALIAICENEFGGAGENAPGTASYRLDCVTREILAARSQEMLPIIYFHTGHEGYPFPSPRRREICRHFVDVGAAAVICMHAHCPQGYETYSGAPIVYGMGNFYFPHFPNVTPAWYHGYVAELNLSHKEVSLSIHPYRFDSAITFLHREEKAWFERYMDYINAPIESEEALARLFDSWCMVPTRFGYYEELSSFAMEMINDGFRASTPKMKNIFTCEAHNELLTNLMQMIFEERIEISRPGVALIEALQRMELPESAKEA